MDHQAQLKNYEAFLRYNRLAEDKRIPYFARWVRLCAGYRLKNPDLLDEEDRSLPDLIGQSRSPMIFSLG